MATLIANFHSPLQNWLNKHWQGNTNIVIGDDETRPEGSGFSATTIILPVSLTRGGQTQQHKVVLRVEPPEDAVWPQQAKGLDVEIDIQYRLIKAINKHSNVNAAPLIGYEGNPEILGAPFFVMEFIDGEVPIENPNYTTEGFFAEATAEQRQHLIKNGIEKMADLHQINWQSANMGWLVEGFPNKKNTGIERQVDLWQQFAIRELRGREFNLLTDAFKWLYDEMPTSVTTGFCWGDARPGNIIWQDFEAACVCDFENACIGPIEIDIGWWLMFDRFSHEAQGFERLPGEPDRAAQLAFYYHYSGKQLGDLTYYEIFAAVRYTAIVVRVMNRLVDRGDLPEDQTLWNENPVAELLTTMFQELNS